MIKILKRLRYKLSRDTQLILWVFGINIHNKYGGECTPDFSCCSKCRTSFFKRVLYAVSFPFRSYSYNRAIRRGL